jgi:hypothetical protein
MTLAAASAEAVSGVREEIRRQDAEETVVEFPEDVDSEQEVYVVKEETGSGLSLPVLSWILVAGGGAGHETEEVGKE